MGTTVTNKNGIEFDIDALATDVNGKADKDLINVSSNVSVCIESWREGTEWYRVYSDGWCDMGGKVNGSSVTFPRTFTSLPNVSIGITTVSGSNNFNYNTAKAILGYSLTVNGFDCTELGQYWRACGYIR